MYKNRTNNNFELGKIQIIKVEDNLYIANMIGQKGIKKSYNKVPIKYEAIETCLIIVATEAKKLEASIHMPRIGCGLAGGKWEEIEPIIKRTLLNNGLDIYVYDFE